MQIKIKFPFFILFLYSLILILSFYSPSYALEISHEDKVKASFIFNFIRFTQWPENNLFETNDDYNICIFNGSNKNKQFIKAFDPIVGKVVNGHVLSFQTITKPKKIKYCQLIYIPQTETTSLLALLNQAEKHKVLSVSDIENFCLQGGMIGIVKTNGKIRIEINLQAVRNSGFTISSNLLEVATIVGSH